jgi:tRNA A37 N6-isopentenylltransferase MiaA
MEVIAFFGPPGTGKSDRALVVAYENKASCIIDDGILIYHSRIVAGKSAKREESRLKAVRRAIFWDAEQREEVRQALEKINPKCPDPWHVGPHGRDDLQGTGASKTVQVYQDPGRSPSG